MSTLRDITIYLILRSLSKMNKS